MITHPELVSTLKKPGSAILASLTPEKCDAWHMASCIPGEAAELFDACRKNDLGNILEELGDNRFYVRGLCQTFDITDEEVNVEAEHFSHEDLPGLAGDVFDATKGYVIYEKAFNREALIKAIGRYSLALGAVSTAYGFTLEQELAHNISKLEVRYKGLKYSNQAAQERADKQDEVVTQNVAASKSAFRVQDKPIDHPERRTTLDAVGIESDSKVGKTSSEQH